MAASVGCKVSASLPSSSKLDTLLSIRHVSGIRSAFGLKPVVSARVSCTLEGNVRSVVNRADVAATAQSLRARDVVGEYISSTQLQESSAASNCMVSINSMWQAKDTVEDFCRSCFMFHDMDVENPMHVFRHIDLLLSVDSYVYLLDKQNEVHLCSSPAMGGLGRDPYAKLQNVLQEQNLLTKRIEDKFMDGVEYYRLEKSLCAAVVAKEEIKIEDVVRAQRIRAFDYRVMDLLLYGLRKKPVNEAHYEFLVTAELLLEIVDDLDDYEKDVRQNTFNVIRFFSYIYGPREAPTKLTEYILKTEEEYQFLLKGVEPNIAAKYREPCEEAIKGGNCRAVPVLGTWKIPVLIADEEAFRSERSIA